MYIKYDEYKSYGGTLDETTFNDFSFEASCIINYWTFNRLLNERDVQENVKRCMYKLISIAKQHADSLAIGEPSSSSDGSTGTSAAIASQSNDGVSVSYNVQSASQIFESSKLEMEDIVRRYLAGVKNSLGQFVLYRGLYPNE